MKRIMFFVVIIFTSTLVKAQNKTVPSSFNIVNMVNSDQREFYTNSILKSNMELYRLIDKTVNIHFENGFDLELLSVKELLIKGIALNPSNYSDTGNLDETKPLFKINEQGIIVVMYRTKETKSK